MVKLDLLPLKEPLLDSRLASRPLKTSIVLHKFTEIFEDVHGFSRVSAIGFFSPGDFHSICKVFDRSPIDPY